MKMKRVLIAASLAVMAALAGCAGGSPIQLKPVTIPVIAPQQLAQQVCPVVQADIDLLVSADGLALLTPKQQEDLAKNVKPKADAVCKATETIDLTDLQAFSDTAFPVLLDIVSTAPIPNQAAYRLGLQMAQPLLKQIVKNAIALSTSTASADGPASGAVAATAAAASSPAAVARQ